MWNDTLTQSNNVFILLKKYALLGKYFLVSHITRMPKKHKYNELLTGKSKSKKMYQRVENLLKENLNFCRPHQKQRENFFTISLDPTIGRASLNIPKLKELESFSAFGEQMVSTLKLPT